MLARLFDVHGRTTRGRMDAQERLMHMDVRRPGASMRRSD